MWIWNDYLLPYLTIGTNYKTIPIAVQYLQGGYGSKDMGAMMALLVLAIIPIVIFYLTSQKHIIKGVAAGALKGNQYIQYYSKYTIFAFPEIWERYGEILIYT